MANLDQTVQISDLIQSLSDIKGSIPSPVQSKQDSASAKPKSSEKEEQMPAEPRVESRDEEKSEGDQSQAENPEETAQSPPETNLVSLESVRARWDEVIKQVRSRKITIGSFLMEGEPVRVVDRVIEIEFGHANSFHIDAIMRCKKMVREVLIPFFGDQIDFKCVKGERKQDSKSSALEDKAKTLEVLGESNPAVKQLIDDFDVEIVEPKE